LFGTVGLPPARFKVGPTHFSYFKGYTMPDGGNKKAKRLHWGIDRQPPTVDPTGYPPMANDQGRIERTELEVDSVIIIRAPLRRCLELEIRADIPRVKGNPQDQK